ncbi:MAG TPA: tetratricopeptide repeat protein [Planctomycetota bacterium]|nr:tetratricopeptide repeat protein [Planctomycetota bacterium]
MTAAASIAVPRAAARSPWFHSASFDLLLILGVPFLTWPLVMAGQDSLGSETLNKLILLTATGHYFATFVRTYGDRELFQRFQTRFVLVPIVLLIVAVGMFASGRAAALLLVTAGWAFWHWLAQAFGFARIYDIKAGSFRPLTAWLDKALVITGFVGAVVLNAGSTATFGKAFLDAGIALPGAAQFAVIQRVVLGAMILVGAAYVLNLLWTISRRQPWSWQKQFMHVTTIGYYWFSFAWLPNVLVAYVLYELFHDIQYYAITWLTCRQRVKRPGVAAWLQRMFRPGWVAAAGFILVMTAFGGLDLGGRSLARENQLHQLWLGVFLTTALLHYYYDGFIWKARESSLGKDLGIQSGLRAAVVPGLRHAACWGLFFVPLLLVLALGREFSPRERAAALVAVAPGDFLSQAELAFELFRGRDLPAAIEHYRAAVAANPDYAQARANFGNALDFSGDLDGARGQFEQALRCRDQGGAHRQAHVNLGVLLWLRGDRVAAQQHFEAGMRLGGEHPIGRMLGLAAALPADAVERRSKLYAAVLQLEPDQVDARLGLGSLLLLRGQFEPASGHFSAVLHRSPDFVPALLGLATARAGLGQLETARMALQRVLERDPGNAQALALQARLGR